MPATVAPPALNLNQHVASVSDREFSTDALHGCRVAITGTAGIIRQLCERDREVLPRWHQEDRGWRDRHRGHHEHAPAGAYAGIRPWNGRDHWLTVVVPAAFDLAHALHRSPTTASRPAALPQVARDTFMQWARIESLYAQDQRTGRRLIVRPSTVASVLGISERHVQRCRELAKKLGVYVEVVQGRMLNLRECLAARLRGSRQRGLSSESALTIPTPIDQGLRAAGRGFPCGPTTGRPVGSVTPTSGSSGEIGRAHV